MFLQYTQYLIYTKIVSHVVKSWISCGIPSVTSITISATTIDNVCIYYTFICCIGFITVYTGIRVVAMPGLWSLAMLGVVTLTHPGASATAGLSSRRLCVSMLHFVFILIKPVILSFRTILPSSQ